MKAIVQKSYGGPETLQLQEVPQPIPQSEELLIRVKASTVNRSDCPILRAKPFFMRAFTGLTKPKNEIPGTDFAGVIEAVGEKVTGFKVGDKVFGFNDMGLCAKREYLTLSEKPFLDTFPDDMTFVQAAASIEGFHYAYNFINKVQFRAGQKVLINGGTGAIGSAMVQLAYYYGGEITATCRGEHSDLVKSLGAKHVIDYTREDFTRTDQKFNYVFDAVGKSTFGKCKHLLVKGGVYISSELGPYAQNPFLALLTPFVGEKKVSFPFPANVPRSIQLIKELWEKDAYHPVIDRTYPLEQTSEAYAYVESGQKVGNVVIEL